MQLLHKIENAVVAHTNIKQGQKRTDWNRVANTVVKSCPKQSADVPDMIEWYKRFLGGASGAHIKSMSAL